MSKCTRHFVVLLVALIAISGSRMSAGETIGASPNIAESQSQCWQTKPGQEAPGDLTCMFYADVSNISVKTVLSQLMIWSSQSPGKSLKLILNSPGGIVVEGFALIDYLKHLRVSGHHVTIVVLGQASSMGAVILQAADHRVIGKHAWMMLHEVAGGASGKISSQDDTLDWYHQLWVQCLEILAERSHLTSDAIRKATDRRDWWLSADKAIEFGFADEILQ